MTPDERLAIAEELAHEISFLRVNELAIIKREEHGKTLYSIWLDSNKLLERDNPIDALHAARQKLAAERESKKSPRERRLEKLAAHLLDAIRLNTHYRLDWLHELKDAATEALKEDN